MAKETPKSVPVEVIDVRDEPTGEIEVGNIVAVQFRVMQFDGDDLVLEPLVDRQSGFPGRVAIHVSDVVFVAKE